MLNSFQLFSNFARLQVFSTFSLSLLNRKAALGRKFPNLGLQQSVVIVGDIVQVI